MPPMGYKLDTLVQVMVVDDDLVDRQGCLRVLRRFKGVGEVMLCASVEAGLQAGPVDLLLLDLNMPGRSGFDMLDAMPPGFARAAMILLGAPLLPAAQTALEAHPHVTGFLPKPLEEQGVEAVLKQLAARGEDPPLQHSSPRAEIQRSFPAQR